MSSEENKREWFPVQRRDPFPRGSGSQLGADVYLKAYEVYSYVYSPQPALLEGSCRGGFSIGEVVAFLYAASFPKEEWRERVDEALCQLKNIH